MLFCDNRCDCGTPRQLQTWKPNSSSNKAGRNVADDKPTLDSFSVSPLSTLGENPLHRTIIAGVQRTPQDPSDGAGPVRRQPVPEPGAISFAALEKLAGSNVCERSPYHRHSFAAQSILVQVERPGQDTEVFHATKAPHKHSQTHTNSHPIYAPHTKTPSAAPDAGSAHAVGTRVVIPASDLIANAVCSLLVPNRRFRTDSL